MDENFTHGKCTYINSPTVYWADGYTTNTRFIKLCNAGNNEFTYVFPKSAAIRNSDKLVLYKNLQSAVTKCSDLGLKKATPPFLECVLKFAK